MKKRWIGILLGLFLWPHAVMSDAADLPTHQLIINEVMAGSEVNPEKDHWFELYNPTDQEILLFGWQIRGVTEGGAWIDLVAEDYRAIQPHDFFLISHYTNSKSSALAVRPQVNKTSIQFPPGPLQIELRDPLGQTADRIFIERNPGEPDYRSYERRQPMADGLLAEHWSRATQSVNLKENLTHTFATPFSANSELLIEEVLPPPPPDPPPAPLILINEVLPNPKKRESEQEFIELLNVGSASVDLRGWELDDENGEDDQSYFFLDEGRDTILDPGEFLVLYNSETLISLGNLGDGVQLFDGEGNLVDDVFYAPELEGRSWGRSPEDLEHWIPLNHPTPGIINIDINHPPAPSILVQQDTRYMTINVTGEQSYDSDGDRLTFLWNYEPGVTEILENPLGYTYTTPGLKTLQLTVTDEFGLSASTQIIFEATPVPGSSRPSRREYPPLDLLSEVMVSPEGNDEEGEWIELFNPTAETLDLSGWFLDDAEGSSTPFRIPDQTFLEPQAYRLFNGLDLSFRNSEDEVRLLDPNGDPKQSLSYREVHENWSYAKTPQGPFEWTPLFTPGALNAFPLPPRSYIPGDLVFQAVLPNPDQKDEGHELIRLRNKTEAPLDLIDWKIQDASGHETFFTSLILEPRQTVVLAQDFFRLTLNNEEEILILFDPAGHEIDRIEWHEATSGQWLMNPTAFQDGLELPVLRVIDGDTVVVSYDDMPLGMRLIGVDTPETVHPFKPIEFFGREASHYLKNRLEGQTIRLTFELNKFDKYGRLLAYAYLGDTLINAELIEKGYGYAYTRFPFKHRDWFVGLETQAKTAGFGLWQNLKVRQMIERKQEEPITEEQQPNLIPDLRPVIPYSDRESETKSIDSRLRGNDRREGGNDRREGGNDRREGGNDRREGGNDMGVRDHATCVSSFLKIDSFLPNPQKGESVEYIRLINTGAETVCLEGWSLDDDISKGSKSHLLVSGSIAPGGVRTFRKSETKIALNNKDDCATLLNPRGQMIDQICYGKTHKNELFTHAGGNWTPQKQVRASAPPRAIARWTPIPAEPKIRVASIPPKIRASSSTLAFRQPIVSRKSFRIPLEFKRAVFVFMILGFLSLFRKTFLIKMDR